MRVSGLRGLRFERLKPFIVPGLLLVAALGPATSLYMLHLDAEATYLPKDPIFRALLTVFPLSTFLLAIFLAQARYRIRLLRAKEAQAVQSAGIDPLSKLPNRLFFDTLLETAMARSTPDTPIALIALDIDHFKTINDTYGHQAGDQLIVGIAERIRRVIRDRDCLARVGGDEFSLILAEVSSGGQCAAMLHRIHDAMLAPFSIGDMQVYVTLSVGVALSPQDGESRSVLMAAADLALYRAKHEGRNRFAFFDKTMEQKLRLGMTIEDDLREAIRSNDLTILYQPQMSGLDGRICGVEALVRWHHPKLGVISPEEFIPLAESRGLIAPLGEWVLRRACRDSRRWPGLRIAVNVSPVQFRNRGFVETVKGIIAESGIPPQQLELELTEGVLIQDADQAEAVIMDLRAQGIRMGLDDFGSGYSSMIYLRRFAFDKIKIDKALLASLETSGEGAIILDSIISLGHALGLTVTAEGVEQKDQVDFLKKLGCDELQGFYFAPGLPAEEIDKILSLDMWEHDSDRLPQADLSAA
jgi:diguanylate cyclase (GGDEF)-like protein